MPATISVGAYNATTHTVAITVTGGSAGELKIYRDWNTENRHVQIVTTDPDYDGTSAAVTDHYAGESQVTYLAYIDGVQQDSQQISVDQQGQTWIISASDTTMKEKVCVPTSPGYVWGERTRRGWFGDVVGSGRTVGVSDVSLGGQGGRFEILISSYAEYLAVTKILIQGVCCIRSPVPENPGWLMVLGYRHRRAGGSQYPRLLEVEYVRTWPTNMTETLPDD